VTWRQLQWEQSTAFDFQYQKIKSEDYKLLWASLKEVRQAWNISTEVYVTKRRKITCCGGILGTKWGMEIIGDGHRGKGARDFFQFSGTYISTTSTA